MRGDDPIGTASAKGDGRRDRRSAHARFGRFGVPLIAAVAVLYGLSGVATAGTSTNSPKPYTLNSATPNGFSVSAGSSQNFSFSITDGASSQGIGSAEVVPPLGITIDQNSVTVPAGATATFASGNICPTDQVLTAPTPVTCLIVNTLGIGAGQTAAISFNATTSCAAASGSRFGSQAQQNNQFNGKPGNQVGPLTDPNAVDITVSGSCTLQFLNQPADANPGATITTANYDPAGAAIEVEALSGSGQPVANAEVTLEIAPAPTSPDPGNGATLLGQTTEPTGGNGIASFPSAGQPGVNIAVPGDYVLEGNSPGFPAAFSAASGFFIGNGTACSGPCSATATDNKTGQSDILSTNSSTGDISVVVGLDSPFCSTANGLAHAPVVTTTSANNLTLAQGTFGKELSITFASKLGPGHFEVCWSPNGAPAIVIGACGKLTAPVQVACLISPISKDNTTGLVNEDIMLPPADGARTW